MLLGGRAKHEGKYITLNNRVVTPKYYWKAVCDPDVNVRQSIVFVAENRPGEISNNGGEGCAGRQQTERRGIVHCHSLVEAAGKPEYADFKLPPFSDANCQPNVRGTFLDEYLHKLK